MPATQRVKFQIHVLDTENLQAIKGTWIKITNLTLGTLVSEGQADGNGFYYVTPLGQQGYEMDYSMINPLPGDPYYIFEIEASAGGYEGRVDNATNRGSKSESGLIPGGGLIEYVLFTADLRLPPEPRE
jgi:hypothetical protein